MQKKPFFPAELFEPLQKGNGHLIGPLFTEAVQQRIFHNGLLDGNIDGKEVRTLVKLSFERSPSSLSLYLIAAHLIRLLWLIRHHCQVAYDCFIH